MLRTLIHLNKVRIKKLDSIDIECTKTNTKHSELHK